VAIVMDGNGRWASARKLPRTAGHRAGAEAVRRTVRAACEAGVPALTLYAFSAQNWGRPADEVRNLMDLLCEFLRDEQDELVARGIRLETIGDAGRLPATVRRLLSITRRATARHRRMTLCLALSYGGRESLIAAARKLASRAASGSLRPEAIDETLVQRVLDSRELPPLDLIIRTSGEQRLSNFLLWEAAYAELYFTDTLWPDFGAADLEAALAAFQRRRRRFGLTDEQQANDQQANGAAYAARRRKVSAVRRA
jgi:undecaprenyl diphosphate synthase